MTTYSKFNEIKTAYLTSLKTLSQSIATYDKYAGVLNDFGKFLEQNYADCEQPDISSVIVLNYINEANKREIKRNTLRHYLIILRSFFKWCVAHKFYAEQPVLESDIPKQERVEYDLLTEEQIDKILNSTPPKYSRAKTALRNRALITLLIQSGLRVSELTALRICDLDFGNSVVRVTHGKGGKQRYTPFPVDSRQLVSEYLNERFKGQRMDENALLFANENGKPYTRQNITKLVNGYVKWLTGKEYIGAHDLRHAAASFYLTRGASLEKIQEILGHSNYATTVIYASHLCPKRVSQDLNSLWDKCAENACNS